MKASMLIVCALTLVAVGDATSLRGLGTDAEEIVLSDMAKVSQASKDAVSSVKSFVKGEQTPREQKQQQEQKTDLFQRFGLQILFGVIYYFMVMTKYPSIKDTDKIPEDAIVLQNENAVMALMKTSFPTCCCSFCCTGPRAAHTFHSTGVLDYWPSLCCMSAFPCCTLWATNSFTDLNEKLGGERQNIAMGCLMSCCCSCCLVAQDAESLDMITGAKTQLCGVKLPEERA